MKIEIRTKKTEICKSRTCNGKARIIRKWYELDNGRLKINTRCEMCYACKKVKERIETLLIQE